MFTFNNWGFYQFIVGLVALIVTIVLAIYKNKKSNKAFGYYISDSIPLISNDYGLESLKVLYKNKPLKDSFIRKFYFENSGKEFIDSNDFIQEVIISFENNVKILDAIISYQSPQNLKPTLSINDSRVILNPIHLNSGDSFQIITITDGELTNPRIIGRIKGVREFNNLNKKYIKISVKLFYFALGIFTFSLITLIIQIILYFILL